MIYFIYLPFLVKYYDFFKGLLHDNDCLKHNSICIARCSVWRTGAAFLPSTGHWFRMALNFSDWSQIYRNCCCYSGCQVVLRLLREAKTKQEIIFLEICKSHCFHYWHCLLCILFLEFLSSTMGKNKLFILKSFFFY